MNSFDFSNWKESPGTKWLYERIEYLIGFNLEALVNSRPQVGIDSRETTAHLKGLIQAYKQILELEPEWPEKEQK